MKFLGADILFFLKSEGDLENVTFSNHKCQCQKSTSDVEFLKEKKKKKKHTYTSSR